MVGIDIGFIPRVRRRHVQKNGLPKRVEIGDGDVGPLARCHPGLLHLETARRLNHRLESGTGTERPNTVPRVIVRDCAGGLGRRRGGGRDHPGYDARPCTRSRLSRGRERAIGGASQSTNDTPLVTQQTPVALERMLPRQPHRRTLLTDIGLHKTDPWSSLRVYRSLVGSRPASGWTGFC